jgi:HD superfamily phosphohydrolase YqeK
VVALVGGGGEGEGEFKLAVAKVCAELCLLNGVPVASVRWACMIHDRLRVVHTCSTVRLLPTIQQLFNHLHYCGSHYIHGCLQVFPLSEVSFAFCAAGVPSI